MVRSIYLFFFLVIPVLINGQTPVIDSLKKIIYTSSGDRKLEAIVILSEQSIDADSLLPFVHIAETIGSSTTAEQDDHLASYVRAAYYVRKNQTDSAMNTLNPLLKVYKDDKRRQPFYLKLLFFKAKIFDRANQYSQALIQLSEVIQTAEQLRDTLIQIQAKTGIGWVQMEMGQHKEALNWLYSALNTSVDKRFYRNYGALYSNLASVYNSMDQYDSANYYIRIAINDARENNNLTFLATALSMQGKIFTDSKQSHLAEKPLNEALEIRKKTNDPFYIVYDMSNLASYYAANRQAEKGIALCKEGIEIAKQSGLTSQLLMIYNALAENYKAANNAGEYAKTLESIIAIKDSFNTINSAKLLSDIQARTESQKKEKQIIENKLAITRKNYWLYGSALFAIMAAIIAWLGFKNYRRKQRKKLQLALEEEKKLAARAIIDAEEHERKRIAADLHDNLGAYAASIASNIDHLSLQQVKETDSIPLQELRSNSQAIVSQLSDTIWALNKNALSLTAISDRIKIFIQKLQPSYPEMIMDVRERIETDYMLQPSRAFHLFQTVQEAISNALKHSGGKNINVLIEGDHKWKICIADNGKGIYAALVNHNGGNGLLNMKNRAKEGGWQIEWLQNEGGGTRVEISPTIN